MNHEEAVERRKKVEDQTMKAGRYYARELDAFGEQSICVRVLGVTMVVTQGELGKKLGKWATRVGLEINEPK